MKLFQSPLPLTTHDWLPPFVPAADPRLVECEVF